MTPSPLVYEDYNKAVQQSFPQPALSSSPATQQQFRH